MIAEGQTLDETYHLQRLVGEGGMGAVYEATHARLAGRYAIKVLLQSLADNADAQALFDREARITSLLQHPNVVQVIDHNTTADGTAYLVMEYLSGESLAARLARVGALSLPAVVDIVEQLAAGLAAAHAHGIVHRDLKPGNIVLVPVEGRASELVKILDFGISKANWSGEAADKGIFGTPAYMAPEQIEGRAADVNGATDQFALAVIAYEMLTGRNPEMIGRVTPPTGLPGQLDAVVGRALARSNAARFSSVTEFAAAFRAASLTLVLTPVPASFALASPAEVAPRVRRGARRPHWAMRVGLGVVAGVAATLLFRAEPPARPSSSYAARVVMPSIAQAPAPAPMPAPIFAATAAPEIALSEPTAAPPPPSATQARSSRRVRPTPAVQHRRASPPSPVLMPDEDATLPMSDAVGAY